MAFCGHPPRDMVGYDKVIKSRQNQTHLQFSINFSLTAAAELCICVNSKLIPVPLTLNQDSNQVAANEGGGLARTGPW